MKANPQWSGQLRFLGLCLLLLICNPLNANTAWAGLFDDEEARKRINDQQLLIGELRAKVQALEERAAKQEETLKNLPLLELYSQTEALKQELNNLRGQIEVLTNENELSQKRQKDFYIDLDTRLRRFEGGGAGSAAGAAPSVAAPATAAPAADNTESRAYEAAYSVFKGGNFKGAIASFQNFLKAYPASNLASGALYWTGNAHYALGDFKTAMAVQQKLLSSYPDSPKVPDAMLNIASCQIELKDRDAAKKTLQQIVAQHPISDAAEKAKKRLATFR